MQLLSSNDVELENKAIYCMEHCKNFKLFGFTIPNQCSHCGSNLEFADLYMPPFKIPSPFQHASNYPCAIVLKPTTGTFLKDYKNSDNLHIGVTSSTGVVYEYNHDGLRNDKSLEWNQCIPIEGLFTSKGGKKPNYSSSSSSSLNVPTNNHSSLNINESLIRQYWDFTLLHIFESNVWTKDGYNSWTNNCFTFVLNFLQSVYHQIVIASTSSSSVARTSSSSLTNYTRVDNFNKIDCLSSTEKFCETFIIEKTKLAAKYITLYRQLTNDHKNYY